MAACRFCGQPLSDTIIDLGASPLSNAFVPADRYKKFEIYYPLHLWFCRNCGLAQLEEFATPDNIFSEYAYFSSFSQSWLEHAKKYVNHMMSDFNLSKEAQVVEIGSNDGYLLQYFLQKGLKPLGIDPAANAVARAREKGIDSEIAFFGVQKARELVERGIQADLALGNNVIAHVPDINDFVEGFRILLKPRGIMTVEFPHLLTLLDETQFDTIYHEHFSYYSLATMQKIMAAHGLRVFRVEELPTHGNSLRVFACHEHGPHPVEESVQRVLDKEKRINSLEAWHDFAENSLKIKMDLLDFLINAKRNNKLVLGYGAAAKGNTLLNYSGIKGDLLPAVADKNTYKQGRYLPGSRIPVITPERLLEMKPDYILVLPWNLREEIMDQLREARSWGAQFVTAIPSLKVQ